MESCAYEVAFGRDDRFYRWGCDMYVYELSGKEWKKLGNRKAVSMSA